MSIQHPNGVRCWIGINFLFSIGRIIDVKILPNISHFSSHARLILPSERKFHLGEEFFLATSKIVSQDQANLYKSLAVSTLNCLSTMPLYLRSQL